MTSKNNTQDRVNAAVTIKSVQQFTKLQSSAVPQMHAEQCKCLLLTITASHLTWTMIQPMGCYQIHPPSLLLSQ